MNLRRPPLMASLSLLAVLLLLTTSGCAAWRIHQSVALARQSEPYQVAPAGARTRLLVVGDSTAVGTGASAPAASVAGLIAREHPLLTVVNRARDGARFSDIAAQLESEEKFDVILVLGGGNDVIRLTRYELLEHDVARTAELARTRARLVIFMPAGNVGNAPFFFAPWSWLMTERARQLHGFVRQAATDNGALYVDLFKEKADDPFAQRPGELHASDGLHPSDAGYRLWYDEMKLQTGLPDRLAAMLR